ncbi:MAG: ParB/RepB/Spo0J family partition protein [Candidatus Bathyarchaeota archaeon]|nr:ParB/RepB/Spo0J family partition protein [Candidatus Termiticorpusculum sp.]
MSLRLNPEYEKMLPTMTLEEFEQLKESIRTEGQHYPIIVSESLEVLDGHHRFRACTELGIEPDFEVKHFEDKLLEKKFVIEANLRRRHLNNFQLVELAVPLLEIEKAIAKKYQTKNKQNQPNQPEETTVVDSFSEFKPSEKTVDLVAKKAGVSTRTLERGKKIIEKASEDDKQKLREGKTSISKIYQEITPQKTSLKTEVKPQIQLSDEQFLHNKNVLIEIFQRMIEHDLFCPECGNKIFQCSKCRKPLSDLVKDVSSQLTPNMLPQSRQLNTEHDAQTEEDDHTSANGDEEFTDEFF